MARLDVVPDPISRRCYRRRKWTALGGRTVRFLRRKYDRRNYYSDPNTKPEERIDASALWNATRSTSLARISLAIFLLLGLPKGNRVAGSISRIGAPYPSSLRRHSSWKIATVILFANLALVGTISYIVRSSSCWCTLCGRSFMIVLFDKKQIRTCATADWTSGTTRSVSGVWIYVYVLVNSDTDSTWIQNSFYDYYECGFDRL